MNTHSKSHPVYRYILDCIDYDFIHEYGFKKQPKTDAEKLQAIFTIFNREYKRNVEKLGERKAYQEWLMGLSVASIDYENYKILELAKLWGGIPQDASEAKEDKIINNWFNFITLKTFTLAKRLKVNTNTMEEI